MKIRARDLLIILGLCLAGIGLVFLLSDFRAAITAPAADQKWCGIDFSCKP